MSSHANWLSSTSLSQRDELTIAVRAYVPRLEPVQKPHKARKSLPSEYTLVFDIETTTDAAQQMRFGVYSLFKHSESVESVLFVDTETMNEVEQAVLGSYAAGNGLAFMATADFIKDIDLGPFCKVTRLM